MAKVNGVFSNINSIKCGVPRGSILGPLLFILYMNDITRMCTECNISLLADDTAIYAYGPNVEIIQHKLQADLNNIQNWLLSNKLSLNVKKCKVLKISTPQHRSKNDPLNIVLNDEQLESVTEYKYLGFWLDSALSFQYHIDKIVKKSQPEDGPD